jgi:Holliday junction resolvase-like predicted endonuclease
MSGMMEFFSKLWGYFFATNQDFKLLYNTIFQYKKLRRCKSAYSLTKIIENEIDFREGENKYPIKLGRSYSMLNKEKMHDTNLVWLEVLKKVCPSAIIMDVEVPVIFTNGRDTFSGRIDVVAYDTETDEIVIVEIKTSEQPSPIKAFQTRKNITQLALYGLFLEKMLQHDIPQAHKCCRFLLICTLFDIERNGADVYAIEYNMTPSERDSYISERINGLIEK